MSQPHDLHDPRDDEPDDVEEELDPADSETVAHSGDPDAEAIVHTTDPDPEATADEAPGTDEPPNGAATSGGDVGGDAEGSAGER